VKDSKVAKDSQNVQARRFTSGLEGFDSLLKGGFIKGATYLLVGPPGSGKTILANQICFHHAKAQAGHVVYITLLAESHSRMIDNLSSFDYFDDKLIGKSITYLSGYHALEKGGLKGLLTLIAGIVREKKATLLMIDGVTTIGELDQSALAFRKFAHELNNLISTYGCTGFLLSSMSSQPSQPEHTMVDGVVALHHENVGLRTTRQIEVRKFRGSDHLQGKHFFSISEEGIHVVPRIESLKPTIHRSPNTKKNERLSFGISGLDEMMGGGVLENSITTLIGAAGVGKTLLSLNFLQAGAIKGEKGLYFGFYETPEDLLEKASALKLDVRKSVRDGIIEILWHPALEQELDELGEDLLQSVRRTKAERVVIDGVVGFRHSATDQTRINRFFVALILKLKTEGVTVLLIEEATLFHEQGPRKIAELSALNETLLLLRNIEFETRMMRVISILKVRSAVYDPSLREFQIDQEGVRVLSAVSSAHGILSSEARSLGFLNLKGQSGSRKSEKRQPLPTSKKR
jgi:circadian clock protein KaiC